MSSYLPSLCSDPLLPMCLRATDPLRDWPLSPTNNTHTDTHTCTHTHVVFMCSAGVATHCWAYKFPAHAHKHTKNANKGPEPEPDLGKILSIAPFPGTITRYMLSLYLLCMFSQLVRPHLTIALLSLVSAWLLFTQMAGKVLLCDSNVDLEDLDRTQCAKTFRGCNYCNSILNGAKVKEKLALLVGGRDSWGRMQRDLGWPCGA